MIGMPVPPPQYPLPLVVPPLVVIWLRWTAISGEGDWDYSENA